MRRILSCSLVVALALVWAPGARADEKDEKDAKAAREIIEKAIKANGGAENLDKYLGHTMKLKGKVNVMGQEVDFTGDWAVQYPDKMRNDIEVSVGGMNFKITQVINKDKGWIKVGDMDTMDMPKEMLEEAGQEMHAGWTTGQLTPLLGKDYTLKTLGEKKVGDRETVGVLVSHKKFRDVSLYFGKKDSLLYLTVYRAKDFEGGGQEVEQEIYSDEYKDKDKLPYPTKLKIRKDGKDFLTAELTDIDQAEKLNDDVFAKP
jgi:hypothetical protein